MGPKRGELGQAEVGLPAVRFGQVAGRPPRYSQLLRADTSVCSECVAELPWRRVREMSDSPLTPQNFDGFLPQIQASLFFSVKAL